MEEKSTVSDTNLEEIIFYTNNSNAISFYYKEKQIQIDIYKSEDKTIFNYFYHYIYLNKKLVMYLYKKIIIYS